MKAGFHSPVPGTGADAPDTKAAGAEPEEKERVLVSFNITVWIWKLRIDFGWRITI